MGQASRRVLRMVGLLIATGCLAIAAGVIVFAVNAPKTLDARPMASTRSHSN